MTTGKNEEHETTQRTNAELDSARTRYFDLYDLAPVGYVTLSDAGLILEANLTAAKLLGAARGDLVSQPISRFIFKEDQDVYDLLLKQLAVSDAPQSRELRMVKTDGATFCAQLETTVAQDEEGHSVRRVTLSDVTPSKILEQQREQYFKFFQLSSEPMCIADPFGCFKHVNPAFVRLTGYAERELISRPYMDFILPEDRQRTADEMKLQVAVRPSLQFENRYACKDGSIVWLSWTAYFDTSDGVTYASARDITELKQAEDALRAANENLNVRVNERTADLQNSNAKLQRLIAVLDRTNELLERTGQMAKVGGWELNLQTLEVTFSKETARIHEVDFPYVPPKLSQGNEYYGPETWPIVQAAVQAAIEHGTSYDLELPFITAKGRHIWVRVQGFAVMENGKATLLHGTFQDITERRQAEESLRAANAELQRLVAALAVAEEGERRRIAEGLHEDALQRLYGANLALSMMATAQKPEDAGVFGAKAEKQIGLVMDLLHSLTFELSSPVLKDLGLAAAMDELCRRLERQHGLSIRFEGDELPIGRAPAVEIIVFQAVRELVHNAVRHARATHIRVAVRRTAGHLELTVEDDGVGFDSAQLAKGFSPSGGYGLYNIRERMGYLQGTMTITPATPNGSRIVLSVPLTA